MRVPARPGFIIRAPEKEKSKDTQSQMDSSSGSSVISSEVVPQVAGSTGNSSRFVVYINTGVCPHSDDIISLAQAKGLIFDKIDVSQATPPSWLPGTPSVVHDKNVYCGDAAFGFVEGLQTRVTQPPLIKGRIKSESPGCGIKAAFAPPMQTDAGDESQFNVSTDDMMQKLLAGRR